MPTIQSVHVPVALGNISIRGRGKKQIKLSEIEDFAQKKGLSFVEAYRKMVSEFYKKECKNAVCEVARL